jgi:hypothetical protein
MRQRPFPDCLSASTYPFALPAPRAATVAHILDIRCPVAKLRDFMSDTPQWLPWTMPALQSVQPLPFGQWLLKTPRNVLKLRLCPAPVPGEPGELLYELMVPQTGSCQVLVRTSPTATGCRVTIMLHKHQPLPLPVCTTSVRHLLAGLRTLKLLLEQD